MNKINNYSLYGLRGGDIDQLVKIINDDALVLSGPAYVRLHKNACADEDGPYLREPKHPQYAIFITVYDVPDWAPIDAKLTGDPRIGATLLERWSEEGGDEI